MQSLRMRLLAGTALGTGALLGLTGALLYVSVKARLFSEFDRLLDAKARTLAGLVEIEGGRLHMELDEVDLEEFSRRSRPEYFEIWSHDGRVLARSPSLGKQDLPFVRPQGAGTVVAVNASLPDGRRGRLLALRLMRKKKERGEEEQKGNTRAADGFILVLGRETADIERTLAGLRTLLLAVGAAALLLSVGVAAAVAHFGLIPVRGVARRISAIGENDLGVRLDPQNTPLELRVVVHRLNELLSRIEAAFRRERNLTADVAHELRTPLAGIRSTLEVALTRDRPPAEYREAIATSLKIVEQTQSMVENLLSLAKLDSGQTPTRLKEVSLTELLEHAWHPFKERAKERGVRVSWEVEPDLVLKTDKEKLACVLGNLFDNAVSYADEGGTISIRASKEGENGIRVTVSNTGSKLSPEEAEKAFDRFWRGSSAREATGLHCGLGLSLSKKLIELIGGRITARSEKGIFSVTLTFNHD